MRTVLCFGDSNTWGAIPNDVRRYSDIERWPAILRNKLPKNWHVIEEGQPGRTTVHPDPTEGERNGINYLRPCLESHCPDLVIIMLGTNDLQNKFKLSADDISRGAARLVQTAQNYINPLNTSKVEVLLISPPSVKEVGNFSEMFKGAEHKSRELGKYYSMRAKELDCFFFDADSIVESSPIDGIHWHVEQHQKMAISIHSQILEIFK
jgi:lysophospholipase L1-like esterase